MDKTSDWTAREILDLLDKRNRIAVSLTEDQRSWNPASTNWWFRGPITIAYEQTEDGTVTASVLPEAPE